MFCACSCCLYPALSHHKSLPRPPLYGSLRSILWRRHARASYPATMRTESTGEACHLAIYAATDEIVLRACRWAMELSSGFRSLEISLSPWIRQRLQGRCPHCCDYRCRFCKPCWHTVIPSSMGPVDTQIAQHDPRSRLVPSRRFARYAKSLKLDIIARVGSRHVS